MSEQIDDFDEDEDTETTEKKNGPADLRRALKAANKAKADLETEIAELRSARLKSTVADALQKHGAPTRLSKYYDKSEASDDDVLAWLKENGEDFGWSADQQEDTDDADTVDEAKRIGQVSQGAAPRGTSRGIDQAAIAGGDYMELRKQGLVL